MIDTLVQFIQEKFQSKKFIPLHEPRFIGREKALVSEAIDSTFVSSVGKFVDQFEEDLSNYTKSEKSIAVVNGTSGLHLALHMSGVTKGDLVITQAMTFVATCNAIKYCHADPIFIDVDLETMGLCPIALNKWLCENAIIDNSGTCINLSDKRKIKACIPMHTFGHPAKIDDILVICNDWGIALIEDAAESLGSIYKNKHTGTFGIMGVLSFNGNKIITTGGGGAILCGSELYKKGKHLSTTAKVPDNIHFFHDKVGFNYRMPNLNAALGCAQLESLEVFIAKKRQLAKDYISTFKDTEINFFEEPKDCRSNFWLNTIICVDKMHRDSILNITNKHNIMTRPLWTPMTSLPMFQNSLKDHQSNTQWFEERIVNIPSSVILDD
jgi:UDP-N-acetylbacillosamine transaminase